MNKAAVMEFVGFILKTSIEYGMEIAKIITNKENIKDSELYARMPRQRKTEALRLWRKMQRTP